ncbi:hypothetical protein Y032_0123g1167 [Ancylostoma ceylanicum]|uniref:Uncharacterized protein n=1 Tax=Ancylostoma ceylanicum TaxID=53326 RepID=A0A016T9S7_9BILA|nr:hypothetical protein Y032_0123g1167 [Ancylostoma ceylanicum]
MCHIMLFYKSYFHGSTSIPVWILRLMAAALCALCLITFVSGVIVCNSDGTREQEIMRHVDPALAVRVASETIHFVDMTRSIIFYLYGVNGTTVLIGCTLSVVAITRW